MDKLVEFRGITPGGHSQWQEFMLELYNMLGAQRKQSEEEKKGS